MLSGYSEQSQIGDDTMRLTRLISICLVILLSSHTVTQAAPVPTAHGSSTDSDLSTYRQQLKTLRTRFRTVSLPDVRFFLFGMGNRSKWIYREGELKNARTGDVFRRWPVLKET
jgi:hypothetical protein